MNDLFDLSGQSALITGASKGLGREMALTLAEAGADLVIGARTAGDIETTANELAAKTGRRVVGHPLDVTDPESAKAFVARAMDEFGRVDILLNNAGINIREPIGEISDDNWRKVQGTNVDGVFPVQSAYNHENRGN
jgi:NAD(P)-dependent dehydrogenase (short-subunit alcohol dehydrogenase family)